MNSNKIQNGKVCFCIKPIHILFIILIVVSVAVILLIPQGTRFQGALIQPQIQQPEEKNGAIVVEYEKEADEIKVDLDSENVVLGKYTIKAENEPIEITAITLELEGNTNKESFGELFLEDRDNVDFIWTSSTTLLVDLSGNSLIVDESAVITLLTEKLNVKTGDSSAFHFIDAVATGLGTDEKITSLGVDGMLDPVPQINKYL